MDALQLLSRQQPGLISIDNFPELKAALTSALAKYQKIVYTESTLTEAKTDKKELSRLRKEIDDRRKEIKKAYLIPYNNFEAQVKELLAMIDAPLEQIKEFVKAMEDREKQVKREEIETYFFRHSAVLDTMAHLVWNSPAFIDSKWLNKTTSVKTWKAEVDEKIAKVARDIQALQATAGQNIGAVTARYLETFCTEGLAEYRTQLTVAEQAGTAKIETIMQDHRIGSKTIKISGSSEVLVQAMEMLSLLGLDCDVLEDDMPQPMSELTIPDFDSFVAFDLETSGTYGAANGDAPAEITEIGAVRVVNGKITERFSMLVNPGRKILPRISHITGITNEMVAGEPGVETAIRLFAEFVSDSILVGHNIKSSDLYYIDRAAKQAGVRLENPYFDTVCFARILKQDQGWESVKLEYLSERLGVEHPNAHRAWCDAEATVGVYFKMQELRS